MIAIGLWHGANWVYLLFGLINGIYFVPLIITGTIFKKKKTLQNNLVPSLTEFGKMFLTFSMVSFADIFFKAGTVSLALNYIKRIFSFSVFKIPELELPQKITILLVLLFIVMEWFGKKQEYAIANFGVNLPKPVRWLLYYTVLVFILFFVDREQQPYVYFKF